MTNAAHKWNSHRDDIMQVTVYTLICHGVTFSASAHIDGHAIQVFGEKLPAYRGSTSTRTFYFPVIRTGKFGETEYTNFEDGGTLSLDAAKAWAAKTAASLGMIPAA
jgi:hypothetical protein